MNLEKLKDTARKLEQKEDWRKAIEVYLRAIQQAESGAETSPDLSLYNRVGDLYLKINDTAEAVRSYERAVDLYADQGFFNNAIALCGKILRVNPGRTQTYLKLCQLHARKNVVSEAKRNLIEFLERMNALGQLDQAFQAVKLFADQFSGSQEIRSMLVELLRATSRGDEAREQLEKMAHDLEASGDKAGARKTRERLHGLETEPAGASAAAPAQTPPRRGGDLIFLDTGVELPPTASRTSAPYPQPKRAEEPAPVSAYPEPAIALPEPVTEPLVMDDPLVVDEPAPADEPLLDEPLVSEAPRPETVPMEDLIVDPMLTGQVTGMGADSLLGLEPTLDTVDDEPLPDLTAPLDIQHEDPRDLDFEPMMLEGMIDSTIPGSIQGQPSGVEFSDNMMMSIPESDTLPEIDVEETAQPMPDIGADALLGEASSSVVEASASDDLADLENRVLDDPENPDLHRVLADKLTSMDEVGRVSEELELALAGYEDRQDWGRAAEMADRLVQLSPDAIAHHQKRVELAYRMGDRAPLIEAYLGLGDALAKSGALDKASAVYGRVIEHDPSNALAAAALKRLSPPEPIKAPLQAPPPPPKAVNEAPPAASKVTSAPKVESASSPATASAPPKAPPAQTPSPPQRTRAATSSNDDFVDLGSMLREEEERPRDTRMRVNRREPKDQDEQREFHEILEQFKRGIDQNLDSDDYQSHYDLGVAFKEMGLLDEAVAEFQKALRSPEGRLRTSEALGMAFYEKGQYAACETVLRRAVESLDEGDEAKIGLLYWLGRASEALGKEADAIASYERAMVVDIRFLDLSQRMQRLSVGRRR
jgi:tetratricopeptide (TPR) repeat protein